MSCVEISLPERGNGMLVLFGVYNWRETIVKENFASRGIENNQQNKLKNQRRMSGLVTQQCVSGVLLGWESERENKWRSSIDISSSDKSSLMSLIISSSTSLVVWWNIMHTNINRSKKKRTLLDSQFSADETHARHQASLRNTPDGHQLFVILEVNTDTNELARGRSLCGSIAAVESHNITYRSFMSRRNCHKTITHWPGCSLY